VVGSEDVTKAHVMEVLDNILSRGANRLANRTLSEMRQMFGFAYTRDIITADPTHRIKKADVVEFRATTLKPWRVKRPKWPTRFS